MIETAGSVDIELVTSTHENKADIAMPTYDIDSTADVTAEQKLTYEKLVSFLKDMTDGFRTDFWTIAERARGSSHELSPKIIDFIRQHGFDIPHFRILDKAQSDELIREIREKQKEKLGLDLYDPEQDDEYPIDHDFTVIFALPKQISQYWKKGDDSAWSRGLDNTGPDIIPWGNYYRRTIHGIRNDIDTSNNKGDLYFDRVPGIAHELTHYYIWNVSSQLSEMELMKERENEQHARQMRSIKAALAEYLEEEPVT